MVLLYKQKIRIKEFSVIAGADHTFFDNRIEAANPLTEGEKMIRITEKSVMEDDQYTIVDSMYYKSHIVEPYYCGYDEWGSYSIQVIMPSGDIGTYGDFMIGGFDTPHEAMACGFAWVDFHTR